MGALHDDVGFGDEGLDSPEQIADYKIYRYHFFDDLRGMHDPTSLFENPDDAKPYVEAARQAFLGAGWEGDGHIGVMWLPPFLDECVGDCWGFYVWHVKQSNNGTSWLASPFSLHFAKLLEQQS